MFRRQTLQHFLALREGAGASQAQKGIDIHRQIGRNGKTLRNVTHNETRATLDLAAIRCQQTQ